MRQYIELFPASHLEKLLRAYFEYMAIPPDDDSEDEKGAAPEPDPEVDHVEVMIVRSSSMHKTHISDVSLQEAFAELGDSLLAHRIVAQLYEQDSDYENAIKVSESGLELVRRAELNWGRPFKQYVVIGQYSPIILTCVTESRRLLTLYWRRRWYIGSRPRTTSAL